MPAGQPGARAVAGSPGGTTLCHRAALTRAALPREVERQEQPTDPHLGRDPLRVEGRLYLLNLLYTQ